MNVNPSTRTGVSRTGGAILVDALRSQGVDRIFGVPGESALPVFDALYEAEQGIQFVICRHEANAAHMAEADGKIRNQPGVCIVSRGPGAMHAAVGLHTAMQDSTPLVLLIGQVPRDQRDREGFQEMNYTRLFADVTKWVAEVDAVERIPEYVARAFHVATQGRPGPVALSLPEDVLNSTAIVADAKAGPRAQSAPSEADMEALRKLLSAAQKPLMIVGGSGWTEQAAGHVRAFAVANDLPVVAGFRSQSIVDNRSDCYVGDLSLGCSAALKARVAEADLLLVAGDALSEVTTGRYALMAIPNPVQKLIHVFPGAEEIGRVFTPVLPIISNMPRFAEALSRLKPMNAEAWAGWRKSLREAYLNYQKPSAVTSELDLAKVMNCLNEVLPDNAVIANGAGNYTIWLHRFYRYCDFGTQLAPKSGCMGYGLPAAIAAKLRYPDRQVIVLAGDGCFVMSSQDFATAVRYGLKIVVLVINNSCYGSIRMHQERHFPGRPSGTDLVNPDFALLAQSYGAFGEVVTRDADFAAAFQRALDAKGPALLELRVDPNRLTPEMRI